MQDKLFCFYKVRYMSIFINTTRKVTRAGSMSASACDNSPSERFAIQIAWIDLYNFDIQEY